VIAALINGEQWSQGKGQRASGVLEKQLGWLVEFVVMLLAGFQNLLINRREQNENYARIRRVAAGLDSEYWFSFEMIAED
jgi:hypothetical protein